MVGVILDKLKAVCSMLGMGPGGLQVVEMDVAIVVTQSSEGQASWTLAAYNAITRSVGAISGARVTAYMVGPGPAWTVTVAINGLIGDDDLAPALERVGRAAGLAERDSQAQAAARRQLKARTAAAARWQRRAGDA